LPYHPAFFIYHSRLIVEGELLSDHAVDYFDCLADSRTGWRFPSNEACVRIYRVLHQACGLRCEPGDTICYRYRTAIHASNPTRNRSLAVTGRVHENAGVGVGSVAVFSIGRANDGGFLRCPWSPLDEERVAGVEKFIAALEANTLDETTSHFGVALDWSERCSDR
jgi:hypothetical protein